MDRGKGKVPTDKNKELLTGKNTLATKEGVNKDTVKQLIDEKNAVKKESAVKAVAEQGKGQEARVPKLEGNDYYKNNPLPKPDKPVRTPASKGKGSSLKGLGQQVAKGLEELADKASPYIDEAAEGLGKAAKFGGIIGGVVGFLNPESTATDEEMGIEQLNSIDQVEPPLFDSAEERDEVFETMASFEPEKPDFLKELEPDIEMDYDTFDMGEPSMDSDSGNGGMDLDFD